MLVDDKQIEQLQKGLDILSKFGIEVDDDTDNLIKAKEDGLPVEIEDICLLFPDDQDYSVYEIEEFLEYISEIDSIKRIGLKTVKTKYISQTLISSSRMGFYGFEDKLLSFSFKGDDINAFIVKNPFLFGVINAKDEIHDDDLSTGACEPYTAIEIRSKRDLDIDKVEELIERFCFYITWKLGVDVYPSEIIDLNEYYYKIDEFYDEEETDDFSEIEISSIPPYSSLHKMYRLAKQIEDPEIQFLQCYKMVEHVSPMAAKKIAYDKLKTGMEKLSSVENDSTLLDPILSVFQKYDSDIRDESLAYVVLESCTDVLSLFDMLPNRLKIQIKGNMKMKNKTVNAESVTDEQLKSMRKQIANILYSTRNRIVHAKYNYVPRDIELQADELDEANEMMDKIARSIIKWNLHLPQGFRV